MAVFPSETFTTRKGKVLELRSMRPADARAFITFYAQVGTESSNTNALPGMVRHEASALEKSYADAEMQPNTLFVGAFAGARVVGMMSLRPWNGSHPWFAHIGEFGLAILQEFWGEGLGRRLLAIQEEFAKARFKRLEARVRTYNDRGIAIYKHNGFAIEGTRKACAFIDGKYCDEYYIAKLYLD